MLEYARWKYVVIVLVLLLSVLYALPNVFPQDPSVQITANRGSQVDAALEKTVRDTLAKAGITPKAIEQDRTKGNLLVRFSDVETQGRANDALGPALGSGYVTALNLASTTPGWLEAIGARRMLMGLDLQGGVRFLMEVDKKAALQKRLDAYAEDLRVLLRDKRITYQAVELRPDNSFAITLSNPADADKAGTEIARSLSTVSSSGQGMVMGTQVPMVKVDRGEAGQLIVRPSEQDLNQVTLGAVEQNIGTLRNRVNELGVAEPLIQRQGVDRIVVELPGIQDTAQAKRLLGATATLEYRGVHEGNVMEAVAGNVPPDAKLYYRRELGPDGKPIPVLLKKRVIATGEQLVTAGSGFDQRTGSPMVWVSLNNIGGQRMLDYSAQHVGKGMAVVYVERIPEVRVVDGQEVRTTRTSEQVISVATIQSALGKEFQTTGLDSAKESADLALLLRAGALAAPMDFVAQSVVGPSLGKENVSRGLRAVLFSLAFAMVFFLIYYRMFGVITVTALVVNLLMVVAVMSVLGFTLTLPGLAGIALTVGMSVDANVLINERIREELRTGLPPQAAIATGYERASGTIADANLTALLAGIALFAFGTGPVKGFAVSLIAGIITSMYTAVSVSRGIATLIYGGRRKLKSIAI